MHVNNGSLCAQYQAAVQMCKDCFGIAVLYALRTPTFKMYIIKKLQTFYWVS